MILGVIKANVACGFRWLCSFKWLLKVSDSPLW